MHKTLKNILTALIFIAIIIAFIIIGKTDFNPQEKIDNEKFDEEYPNVSSNNVYKYVNASEVYSFLRGGTGVLFMGYPANEWTGYYASILNDVALELGLKEILYYDFYENRDVKNAVYQSIVLKLSNFLPTLDDGTQNIYAPTLIIVKNGEIIWFDNETAITSGLTEPADYWNEFKIEVKKNSLKQQLNDYLNSL